MLRHSLEVLAGRDPQLVERLCWPVDGSHVVRSMAAGGEVSYRLHQSRYRLSIANEAVDAPLTAVPPEASEIFVFGVGLGEQVTALLTARPQAVITAWDRDPWLLRLALERNDWSAALASGRLRLLLGSDLVAFAAAGSVARCLVSHPLLGSVYQNEQRLLSPAVAHQPLVALCAGGLFTDDLAGALRDEGFAVYVLDVHRLSQEESKYAVVALRPDFIAAINYTEGLAEFAHACGCQLVVWEIDPATSALPACRAPTDGAYIFTYRKTNVADYRAAGFANVDYLPLAADPRRRARVILSSDDRRRYGAPIAFVGSSLMPQVEGFRQAFVTAFAQATAALAPGAARPAENPASVMDDVLTQQRRDFGRYVIPSALAARAPMLNQAAPDVLAQLARPLGEIAAAEKRTAYLTRLAQAGLAVDVWGDDGWSAAAAAGVRFRGSAGHAVELTKIYNASAINLDIGRLYQDDIVTMRVFDVLACGGFILAEYSDALADLFQLGVEIDCYRDADELEAKVRLYLDRPEQALKVAARGQHAVLTRHTVALRLRQMLTLAGLGLQRGEVVR